MQNFLSSELVALFGNLPMPVAVVDLATSAILFLNPGFVETTGYTRADLPDIETWAKRFYPDPAYRAEVMLQWDDAVAERRGTGKVKPPREFPMVDAFGRTRAMLFGFALHGDIVVITLQDVTDLRATEAELAAERRRNEQTAYALTENMPAGAYTMVLRPGAEMAEFAFLSRRFLEMLELTREEAVGDPSTVFSRVHPEDHAGWLKKNAEAFARKAPFSGEARIIAHGETRWIRAESVPRDLEDGTTIWEGFIVDVTELKEAERRLREVIDAARGYTWKLDLRTKRLLIDRHWSAAEGSVLDDASASLDCWLEGVHPEDAPAIRAGLEALLSGAQERVSVTYRRRQDGDRWRWLQIHGGVGARDAGGKPAIISGVSFDITDEMAERARAEEEQAQLREDLQRAQQRDTVAQVAGGVAHDINNLIAVVAGTAEMMARQADGQPQMQDGLERILRTVGMARELVTNLGALVRHNRSREMHDLARLLRHGMDLLGSRRLARHAVRLELPKDPVSVWADPTELAQVIVNLALNACDSGTEDRPAKVVMKVLPAGTPLPDRRPDAGDLPPPGLPMSVFTISDTGNGITEEVRAGMFRPNFTTKGGHGTGLGLPIVSTVLLGNNAALWVETMPGHGTTMTVGWPAAPSSAGVAAGVPRSERWAERWAAASPELLNGLTVLVVDDRADVAEVLGAMLESAGAEAACVSDPLEAARVLAEEPALWSALVTDLHMDGMDGRALARHAAALVPPVPVVLVTARPDALGEGAGAEFAAILSKPVSGTQLTRAVRAAFDGRAAGAGRSPSGG